MLEKTGKYNEFANGFLFAIDSPKNDQANLMAGQIQSLSRQRGQVGLLLDVGSRRLW